MHGWIWGGGGGEEGLGAQAPPLAMEDCCAYRPIGQKVKKNPTGKDVCKPENGYSPPLIFKKGSG